MRRIKVNGNESNHYYADEQGNIFSKQKEVFRKLKVYKTHDGYRRICLAADIERGHYRVCRIIAETFIENPENLPIVNHKNEVRDDDRVLNLEWCDNSHNQKQRFKGKIGTRAKEVEMVSLETKEVVASFPSLMHAEKDTGIQSTNIGKVCLGKRNQAGGYSWRYKDCPSVETSRKA